jgi:hypothetical protein
MLHNLTNKQGSYDINGKLASGNRVNVVNSAKKPQVQWKCCVNESRWNDEYGKKKDQCIIIVGDSHSKVCATNVKIYLSDYYKGQGLVIPGTCSDTLTKIAMNVMKNLTKNDFLILWSGENDVAKNNTMKAFRCLVDFAKFSSHTNVILASVPHRHDLMSSSCVNEEVRAFNRKLMKIRKIFGHVSIMEVDPNREYYAKHGDHLNNLRKAKVSKQLSLQLLSVLQWKKDIPISLSWTRDHDNNRHDETQDQVEKPPSATTIEQNNSAPRTSNRLKKTPATMNKDFFWTTGSLK